MFQNMGMTMMNIWCMVMGMFHSGMDVHMAMQFSNESGFMLMLMMVVSVGVVMFVS